MLISHILFGHDFDYVPFGIGIDASYTIEVLQGAFDVLFASVTGHSGDRERFAFHTSCLEPNANDHYDSSDSESKPVVTAFHCWTFSVTDTHPVSCTGNA